jgi:hypothetical protein
MFWSHKVLRWLTPHMLLLLFVLLGVRTIECFVGLPSVYCLLSTVFLSAACLMTAGALVARRACRGRPNRYSLIRPLLLLDHFVTMQVALFVGFLRYCRGHLGGAWERTPREGG